MYGNPETTPGGRALKFYSSVRIDVRKVDALKTGSDVYGNRTRAKVVKNKVASPFKVAEFDIVYGTGISKSGEILDIAVDLGIIAKSGAWFSYGEDRIGQGKENVRKFLESNPDMLSEIEGKVRALYQSAEIDELEKADLDDDLDDDEFDIRVLDME